MKITTQQELNDLIATANESNTIFLDEDLEITFSCIIPCSIEADNITACSIHSYGDITADNITALDIKAEDIEAGRITAWDIDAHNIDACNINACSIHSYGDITADNITALDIKAHNIKAQNIEARNIEAKHIKYHAFCIAYQSLKCESIAGERENSFHKCLDQEIEFIK
jgi:hypothetical protein